MRVSIIADDLTGACDSVGAFAGSRAQPQVSLDMTCAPSAAESPVRAVDLDTRHLSPAAAASRTLEAAMRLRETAGPDHLVIKKIDSTLRGNIEAEIAALIRTASAPLLAVVAPAFPATGRTVRGGRVFVDGTALAESAFGRSNGLGPGAGDVAVRFRAAGFGTAAVGRDLIAQGADALADRLDALRAQGHQAAVCDSETHDDLATICRAVLANHAGYLLVGSGGLTRALAGCLRFERVDAHPVQRDKPCLLIVGSTTDRAAAQIDKLLAARPIHDLMLDPQALMAENPAHIHDKVRRALMERADVLVRFDRGIRVENARDLARRLGEFIAPCVRHANGLFLTGGETARCVFDALGVTTLHIASEIEPGIPLAAIRLDGRAVSVVLKAGGFGGDDTLVRAHSVLTDTRDLRL